MNVSKKELQVRLFRVTAIIRTMDSLQRQPADGRTAEFTDNWTESNAEWVGLLVHSLVRCKRIAGKERERERERERWRADGTFQNEFDASNVKMLHSHYHPA